jgi:RimJ/RimL family protein N-acetyltransferase
VTQTPSVIIRPATREDINGFIPIKALPTVKAWCMEVDGKIVALGGIARNAYSRWVGFIDLVDEARTHKVHIVRNAIRFLAACAADGIRYVYAEVSPDEPRALAFLTRLGFETDPRSPKLLRWRAS